MFSLKLSILGFLEFQNKSGLNIFIAIKVKFLCFFIGKSFFNYYKANIF